MFPFCSYVVKRPLSSRRLAPCGLGTWPNDQRYAAPWSRPPNDELRTRTTDVEEELQRIERLVDLLDSQFALPGTDVRIGLDPIIGLIPGIGDAVMFFASFYVVERLSRLGLSWHVRARMHGNIVIDALVGLIPVLGDVIDVVFKANRRNLALARRALFDR